MTPETEEQVKAPETTTETDQGSSVDSPSVASDTPPAEDAKEAPQTENPPEAAR